MKSKPNGGLTGLPLSTALDSCPHCSQFLDIDALICCSGGDVVTRHNRLRDCFKGFCNGVGLQLMCWSLTGLSHVQQHSTWRSSICSIQTFFWERATSGFTAELGEHGKHSKNDVPCTEHGWMCPISCWGIWQLGKWSTTHFLQDCKEASHPVNIYTATSA